MGARTIKILHSKSLQDAKCFIHLQTFRRYPRLMHWTIGHLTLGTQGIGWFPTKGAPLLTTSPRTGEWTLNLTTPLECWRPIFLRSKWWQFKVFRNLKKISKLFLCPKIDHYAFNLSSECLKPFSRKTSLRNAYITKPFDHMGSPCLRRTRNNEFLSWVSIYPRHRGVCQIVPWFVMCNCIGSHFAYLWEHLESQGLATCDISITISPSHNMTLSPSHIMGLTEVLM